MENITLTDLSIIIPLLEEELDKIHSEIESQDEDVSDAAAELSVPYGNTSAKLQALYKSLWSEDCNYPSYEELISRK